MSWRQSGIWRRTQPLAALASWRCFVSVFLLSLAAFAKCWNWFIKHRKELLESTEEEPGWSQTWGKELFMHQHAGSSCPEPESGRRLFWKGHHWLREGLRRSRLSSQLSHQSSQKHWACQLSSFIGLDLKTQILCKIPPFPASLHGLNVITGGLKFSADLSLELSASFSEILAGSPQRFPSLRAKCQYIQLMCCY